jgi:hypothetical protein
MKNLFLFLTLLLTINSNAGEQRVFEFDETILIQEYKTRFIPWRTRIKKFSHLYQGSALTFCQFKGFDKVEAFEMEEVSESDISYFELNRFQPGDPRFNRRDISVAKIVKRADDTFYLEFSQERLDKHLAYKRITCSEKD